MRRNRLLALLAVPLVLGLVAFAASRLMWALSDPLIRHGAHAEGTILATGGAGHERWAEVHFAGPAGDVVTTIAVCHHQSYETGQTVPVVYDARQPSVAGERDMYPSLTAVLLDAGSMLLMALAAGSLAVRTLRRRPEQAAPGPAVVEPEPEPATETAAEWLEDVLVGAGR